MAAAILNKVVAISSFCSAQIGKGVGTVSSFCSKHSWEIIRSTLVPTSAAVVYFARRSWIKDSYTDGKGISCAIALNTAVFWGSHLIFQVGWAKYSQKIKDRENQVSQAQKDVNDSQKRIKTTQVALENVHKDISSIRRRMEEATKSKQDELNETEREKDKQEKAKRGALANRNNLIKDRVLPVLKTLDEDAALGKVVTEGLIIEEREHHSRIEIPLASDRREQEALRELLINLKDKLQACKMPIDQAINQAKRYLWDNNVNKINLDEFIKDIIKLLNVDVIDIKIQTIIDRLHGVLKNIQLIIDDLNLQNLQGQIDDAKDQIKRLNADLIQAERAAIAAASKKMAQEEEIKSLRAKLREKKDEEERLRRELRESELVELKGQYDKYLLDLSTNEEEIKKIKSGILPQSSFSKENLESFSPTLFKLEELKEVSAELERKMTGESSLLVKYKDAFIDAYHEMYKAIKDDYKIFRDNLHYWLMNNDLNYYKNSPETKAKDKETDSKKTKDLEIDAKRISAIQSYNDKDEDIYVGLLRRNSTNYSQEQKTKIKAERNTKINAFYDEIAALILFCRINVTLNIEDKAEPTISLAIPDWDEDEGRRQEKIRDLKFDIERIKKANKLFLPLKSLIDCLTQQGIKVQSLFHAIDGFSKNLDIFNSLSEKQRFGLKKLKDSYELFHESDSKHTYLNARNEEFKTELKSRDEKLAKLNERKKQLEKDRDSLKQTVDRLDQRHREKLAEIECVKKQIIEINTRLGTLETPLEAPSGKSSEKKEGDQTKTIPGLLKSISDKRTEIADKTLEITPHNIKIDLLKLIVIILQKLVPATTDPANPALLNQLRKGQKELDTADGSAQRAKEIYEKCAEEVLQVDDKLSGDLTKAEESQRDQFQGLKKLEKEHTPFEVTLLKPELDRFHLSLFLKILEKCKIAINFYKDRRGNSKEIALQGLQVQEHFTQVAEARLELSSKKQELNLRKVKLDAVAKPEDARLAEEFRYQFRADEARCQVRVLQLKRLKLVQEWRLKQENQKNIVKDLLRKEDELFNRFYVNKILIQSKNKSGDTKKYLLQYLYSILDSFTLSLYYDFIRYNDERPNYPDIIKSISIFLKNHDKITTNFSGEHKAILITALRRLEEKLLEDKVARFKAKLAEVLPEDEIVRIQAVLGKELNVKLGEALEKNDTIVIGEILNVEQIRKCEEQLGAEKFGRFKQALGEDKMLRLDARLGEVLSQSETATFKKLLESKLEQLANALQNNRVIKLEDVLTDKEIEKVAKELGKEPIAQLNKAFQEGSTHKKFKAPTLNYFYNELEQITIDFSRISKYKIPIIKARLELIRHLSIKPYKKDFRFRGNFEEYQKKRNSYRKKKFQKREELEKKERDYIENKAIIQEHKDKIKKANERALYTKIEEFIQTHFFEKALYLIPAALLYLAYAKGKLIKFSRADDIFILSIPAGKTIFAIMAVTYLYLQGSFPSIYIVDEDKKLEPGISAKQGAPLAQSDAPPPASPAAPASAAPQQRSPVVSVVPVVQQQP